MQKTHVARLKFPAPATPETWVTDQHGDPVFMVVAEPSQSLAGELKALLPKLRQIVGDGRRVTVCFDRGGWSPALFADILAAAFDLLTYRKGPAPDLPAAAFTTIKCADDRGRAHEYTLADTTTNLDITEGPLKGQQVSLRQVTRRVPARRDGTRQIHTLTTHGSANAGRLLLRTIVIPMKGSHIADSELVGRWLVVVARTARFTSSVRPQPCQLTGRTWLRPCTRSASLTASM